MKTYTKYNFFKHTYCEFVEVSSTLFEENKVHYKSKSDSQYFYTKEGVYRYSDHWGRVANCRWKLLPNSDFKNQKMHLGYANWVDFYHLNDTDKLFFIQVDLKLLKVNFQHKGQAIDSTPFLFTAMEAQKRVKQIRLLLKEDKWAKYYTTDINELRQNIILAYINSNTTIQVLKQQFKK
ncbi:MAG: hypothetical protein ACPG45_10215 [Flavobacteriaceae bacterium]